MKNITNIGMLTADMILSPVVSLPQKGKLVPIDHAELTNGGCALNTTIALSKLGIKSTIIGKIGDDGCGHFLLDRLKALGLDTKGVRIDPTIHTSATAVMVSEDGERTFLHSYGANGTFTETDVDYALFKKTDIVNIGGVMLLPAFDGWPCAALLETCKQMGKITVLDTAWDSSGRWMEILEPSMPYIDVFMPSLDEAIELSGKTDPEEIADEFLSMGVNICVIKLGPEGCLIKQRDQTAIYIDGYKNIKVADTTGAGDAFVAGFLAGLAHDWDITKCGRFANAVGAHCVMGVGASSGIKPMAEVIKFMNGLEV